jgi:hypothetical protein
VIVSALSPKISNPKVKRRAKVAGCGFFWNRINAPSFAGLLLIPTKRSCGLLGPKLSRGDLMRSTTASSFKALTGKGSEHRGGATQIRVEWKARLLQC